MSISNHKHTKVIVGLGKTGLSVARYFANNNIDFAVMDTRENPPGLIQFQKEFPSHSIYLGGLDENVLLQADEIIVSPGLSSHEPILLKCQEKDIPIIGDIEIFAKAARAPICAITGSNAKSTVTSIIGEMARVSGLDVRVGGNLGTPALDLLNHEEPDLYVLELSSFQLETTYSLSATAATILNICEDHMDRYSSLEEYIQAKQRIYHGCEFIIWNRYDKYTKPPKEYSDISNITFGLNAPKSGEFGLISTDAGTYIAYGDEPLICVRELGLKGSHNWANAMAALAMGYAMSFPMSAMLQALQSFKGLPHRCQWVMEKQNVAWFNDSKGTNVGASIAAIKGIAAGITGKIILIAGGLGKGADFSELKNPVAEYVRAIILIGEDAPKIEKTLKGACAIKHAATMEEAVLIASQNAEAGDAVLLSPACASFDMFKNFEHRGDVFITAVKDLLQ